MFFIVGYVTLQTTVGAVEDALDADMRQYTHDKLGDANIVRCLAYSLPASLSEHIAFVGGTVRFPSMRDVHVKEESRKRTSLGVTPSVVRAGMCPPGFFFSCGKASINNLCNCIASN